LEELATPLGPARKLAFRGPAWKWDLFRLDLSTLTSRRLFFTRRRTTFRLSLGLSGAFRGGTFTTLMAAWQRDVFNADLSWLSVTDGLQLSLPLRLLEGVGALLLFLTRTWQPGHVKLEPGIGLVGLHAGMVGRQGSFDGLQLAPAELHLIVIVAIMDLGDVHINLTYTFFKP
jgi:hypothetical protein